MRVTGVEEYNKSRSKIYIDGEFAFVLYKGELRFYHIAEGNEITEETYQEIMDKVLGKRAKLRAMNLLTAKEYTEKQLYTKLKTGMYPEKVIEDALAYVRSYHYTDDLRYAVSYMGDYESSRSKRRIEEDLLRKGISKTTIEKAWTEWENKGGTQDECAMINTLLAKRGFDAEKADMKERQKTYAFLARKGFSGENIRKCLKADFVVDE